MAQPVSVKPTSCDEMGVTAGRAREDDDQDQYPVPVRARTPFGRSAGAIIAGAVLASIIVGVVANLADIKRYIRITRM